MTTDRPIARSLDAGALRALAHPLRIELFDALANYGPATASGLAERLGESSGSTSYHLRLLAREGLVREVEGRGTGRERWWERSPGDVSVSFYDHDDESGRTAAQMVSRQWERSRASLLADFSANPEAVGRDWYEAASLDTGNVTATIDELRAIVAAFREFEDRYLEPLRHREAVPGSRRVQVHLNAFPLVGSHVEPAEPSSPDALRTETDQS